MNQHFSKRIFPLLEHFFQSKFKLIIIKHYNNKQQVQLKLIE